jgi:hypothetical protein
MNPITTESWCAADKLDVWLMASISLTIESAVRFCFSATSYSVDERRSLIPAPSRFVKTESRVPAGVLSGEFGGENPEKPGIGAFFRNFPRLRPRIAPSAAPILCFPSETGLSK